MFLVYYSNFKKSTKISQLIGQPMPKLREEYLATISDFTRRGQSRAVFALLNLALRDMGAELNPDDFYVEENGRWKIKGDRYVFSLSHSGDTVAVAVVDKTFTVGIDDVGIDVEEVSPRLETVQKFIVDWEKNNGENFNLDGLEEWDRLLQLTKLWSKRESQIKCDGREFSSVEITDDWQTYILSVSVKGKGEVTGKPIFKQV